ncbi:MAG: hypothetical protein ABI183_15385 [Polyangiaceae bacterium]
MSENVLRTEGRFMVMASAAVDSNSGDASGDGPFITGFVVVSQRPSRSASGDKKAGSRIFKVRGAAASPQVTELPSATTIDLQRFQREVSSEVEPMLESSRAIDAPAALTTPPDATLIDAVRAHLEKSSPS